MSSFSIKIKYSLFLAVLLMLTVLVLSLFVLQGIRANQLSSAEQTLLNHTRTANVSIKQAYYEASAPDPQPFLRRRGLGRL
jgi:two-component system phosphate regulon sensor histidine kinase PhoR